jgi:membrane-bound lytic murein transglycosylase D
MKHFFLIIILIGHFTCVQSQNQQTLSRPEIKINEATVKHRLDSLNNLTPLELTFNTQVLQQIKFYLLKRERQVSKMLALSSYYFPIFETYLDKYNLPLELKYLPIIESGLNPKAKSSAGAAGLWQFMYNTAKEHGLRINSYLDERMDIYKSTDAACNYLTKSYNIFHDWELSLASYNAGRRSVKKSIIRSGGHANYWSIRPFLPLETRNYIPSFIAAVYVMNFAEEYGIRPDTNYLLNKQLLDSIFLKKSVKISHLSSALNIEEGILKKLNPTYKIKIIPSLNNEKFPIILPQDKADEFLYKESRIYALVDSLKAIESETYPEYSDVKKIRHKVKRGDVLGTIAQKYNCKVKDIMLWNNLKGSRIKLGQSLIIYQLVK